MRAARNLFFLAPVLAVVSVCSVQHNQNPIPKDNVLMHNAIIKGDTETMKLLLDKSSVKLDGLDPGTPEWGRDLPSLYKRSIRAKSPEERAQPEATMQQAKSSSEPDATSNVQSLAAEFLKYSAVASCSKNNCTILVTNFALPDGNTSPYGMQLADELSNELTSQNHKIQVIDRGLLQNFLAKDRVPAKSVNAGLVHSISSALKARFVVLGTTKRTNDDVVQLSTRLFDVADKYVSGYNAVVNLLAPKSSVDLSSAELITSLPPITSTASGESIYRWGVDGVSMPKCTYMPSPPTEEARKFQLSGSISVDAVLNSEGKLENVRIIRGLPNGLNEATLATMKTWRCNPALKDGKPVFTLVQFEVHFEFRPN
jgi:TonB family protein